MNAKNSQENLNVIWQKVVSELKNSLEEIVYQSYLLPSRLHEIKENNAVVVVDSIFAKRVLSSSISIKVNKVLNDVTQTNLKVLFILNSEIEVHKQVDSYDLVKKPIYEETRLKDEYIFGTFVKGASNQGALLAALEVTQKPGEAFNPLFIYGSTGLGKTHLLHSIGNEIMHKFDGNKKVLYLSSNVFLGEFHIALKHGIEGVENWKKGFLSFDVILLDDIQMLAKKEKTNEILFDVMNNFLDSKKQLVFASDEAPNKLNGFEKRMISRLELGLTVNINKPTKETAMLILKSMLRNWENKQGGDSSTITDDALEFISENFREDVRRLQGAFTRVFFASISSPDQITIIDRKFVETALADTIPKHKTLLNSDAIIQSVADKYGIDKKLIYGKTRTSNIAKARHAAMYLCRKILDMTYVDIGNAFGGKDHTTVMNAINNVETEMKKNKTTADYITKVREKLEKNSS